MLTDAFEEYYVQHLDSLFERAKTGERWRENGKDPDVEAVRLSVDRYAYYLPEYDDDAEVYLDEVPAVRFALDQLERYLDGQTPDVSPLQAEIWAAYVRDRVDDMWLNALEIDAEHEGIV